MAQDFSALVALHAKQGELTALRRWNRTSQMSRVQPLVELVPGSSPHSQLDKVDQVARSLHASGRHLMIDATEVAHMPSFGSRPAGALRTLADRLDGPVDLPDAYPVPFEPVIRSDVEDDVLSACRNLCQEMGLGGTIRIRLAELTRTRLSELLERTGLDNADLDLIIDLQYVGQAGQEPALPMSSHAAVCRQPLAVAQIEPRGERSIKIALLPSIRSRIV